MNFKNIKSIEDLLHKYATVHSITMYHGTDGNNLETIMREGLKPIKGSVYLTPDIETAAYYSTFHKGSNENPIVLELVLTKGKRIKKLHEDPMDQPYLSMGEYSEPSEYGKPWDESVRDLENDLEKIIGRYAYIRDLNIDTNEIENLDGINIYKKLIDFAQSKNIKVDKIKQLMFKIIPPGEEYEYIKVMDDGTLKLTENYYNEISQLMYNQEIPPSAIKAIWIPSSNLTLYIPETNYQGETKNIGRKLLPGDIGNLVDNFRQFSKDVWYLSSIKQKNAIENEDLIEELVQIVAKAQNLLKEYELEHFDISELMEDAQNGNAQNLAESLDYIAYEALERTDSIKQEQWIRIDKDYLFNKEKYLSRKMKDEGQLILNI